MQSRRPTLHFGSLAVHSHIRCSNNPTLGRRYPHTAACRHSYKIRNAYNLPHSPSRGSGWQAARPSPTRTDYSSWRAPTHFKVNTHTPFRVTRGILRYFLDFAQEEVPLLCQSFVQKHLPWSEWHRSNSLWSLRKLKPMSPTSQPHYRSHRDDKAEGNKITWKTWYSRLSCSRNT